VEIKQIEIKPGNFTKLFNSLSLLHGVVLQGSTLLMEFESANQGTRYVSSFRVVGDCIEGDHYCMASRTDKPCWHLAAAHKCLSEVFNKKLSMDIKLRTTNIQKVAAGGRDCTHLLTTADMQLLSPDEVFESTPVKEHSPVEDPDDRLDVNLKKEDEIEHPDDRWLARLKLPSLLLERVIAFREEQRARLSQSSEDWLSRIPNLGADSPERSSLALLLRDLSKVKRVNYVAAGDEVGRILSPLLYNNWQPVMLTGNAGTRKTYLAYFAAAVLMLPVTVLSGSLNTNAETLLGEKEIDAESEKVAIKHVPGILLGAIQNGGLLVFNEINQALPDVLSILNDILDWQKRTYVQGIGEIEVSGSFRLVATRNLGYVGTSEMNRALVDRFHDEPAEYAPKEVIKSIIEAEVPGVKGTTAEYLSQIYSRIVDRVESGELDQDVVSVRSLIRAAENSIIFGPKTDIIGRCLTSGIYDENTREILKEIAGAYFL